MRCCANQLREEYEQLANDLHPQTKLHWRFPQPPPSQPIYDFPRLEFKCAIDCENHDVIPIFTCDPRCLFSADMSTDSGIEEIMVNFISEYHQRAEKLLPSLELPLAAKFYGCYDVIGSRRTKMTVMQRIKGKPMELCQ